MPKKKPIQWHFRIVAPNPRPIRREEIYLLLHLLPPNILELIASDEEVGEVEQPNTATCIFRHE